MIPACWTPANALSVLAADAGNDADLQATFAATHRPVAGIRHQAGQGPVKIDDASADARDVLSSSLDHRNPVLIPVLGEPGTGKSHLVRWVWTWFNAASDPRFTVVYIPRARMSLGGVMDRLLRAAREDPDPAVAESAEALVGAARNAFDGRDVDFVARELRNETVFQLSRAAADKQQRGDVSPADANEATQLAALLSVLLTDGGDAEDYLHSEQSSIGRKVRELIYGRDVDAGELPAAFDPAELQALNDLSAGQTRRFKSALVRVYHQKEFGELGPICDGLNTAIELAVSELLNKSGGPGGISFGGVFRQLRESLYRADRELLIFVEELKVLGGIERSLLEGFLDNATAMGEEPICRVRALLACTRGEWDRLANDMATLRSRLDAWSAPSYDLDARALGDEPFERQDVVARAIDMAAYYMNAARVGVDELESGFSSHRAADDWTPRNACTSCAYRDGCHHSFGAVTGPDGEPLGLYPFTATALARAQETVQGARGAGDLETGLNPRVLLTGVLEPMLELCGDSPVPAREIAIRLNAAPSVLQDLAAGVRAATGASPEEADRGAGALAIWGESKTDDRSRPVTELPSPIGTALGLVDLPPVAVNLQVQARVIRRPVEEESESGLSEAVRAWRDGGAFLEVPARDLRSRVYSLVVSRVDWQSLTGARPKRGTLPGELGLGTADTVRLEDAPGERELRSAGSLLHYSRDQTAFLAAVAQFDDKRGFVGGVPEFLELAEGLEVAAGTVTDAVAGRGIGRGIAISVEHPGIVALAAMTMAAGLDSGDIGDGRLLLSQLVAPTPALPVPKSGKTDEAISVRNVASDGITAKSGDVIYDRGATVNRDAVLSWLLSRFGYRRSATPVESEQVQMLDVAALHQAVSTLARDSNVRPFTPDAGLNLGESAAHEAIARSLPKLLGKALGAEIRACGRWRRELFLLLGEQETAKGEDVEAAIEVTVTAIAAARAALLGGGLVPGGSSFAQLDAIEQGLSTWLALEDRALTLDRLVELGGTGTLANRHTARLIFAVYVDLAESRHLTGLLAKASDSVEHAADYVTAQRAGTTTSDFVAQFADAYRVTITSATEFLERSRGVRGT